MRCTGIFVPDPKHSMEEGNTNIQMNYWFVDQAN